MALSSGRPRSRRHPPTGYPGQSLFADDAVILRCTHKTPAIKAWLARHPRFHMHLTPTGSSWINQVEHCGYLTGQKIRRGARKSVQALEKDIRDWIAACNTHPRPFIWTKTAEEILESLARCCRRISDAGH
jgi:hypothetical protein